MDMRNKNYYINLNDREYLDVLSSLMVQNPDFLQKFKVLLGVGN